VHIDLILFDWGGTLVSVTRQGPALREGAHRAVQLVDQSAGEKAAQNLVDAILSAETRADADPKHREADLTAVITQWAQSLGVSDCNPINKALDALGNKWVGSLDLLPDTLHTLRSLRQADYRMGLVTNCSVGPPYCHQEFKRQGLTDLLEFAVFSSIVGYRKPHPLIYEQALDRAFPHGRPGNLSRVLFVGDSPGYDVIAPAAMGMKTVLIKNTQFAWPREDYTKAKPDFQIESVNELPALLPKRTTAM